MASFHKTLYIFFPFFFTLLSSSNAYTFSVGGRDGWTLHPSENYNQWSGRLRFIVNDALHFKYNGGSDSVLEVNNGDYDKCNTTNPITKLAGGDSYFTLNRAGPFYFISGNKSNCDQGQKLTVVVISPKTKSSPPPAGVASPPESSSPTKSSPPPAGVASPPESSSPTKSSPPPAGVASPPGSSSPTKSSPPPAGVASPPGSLSPLPSSESPISSPPQPGTTIPATPASSPGGTGSGSFSPAGTPAYSPDGSISSSPAFSPGGSGSPSSSPTGNPAFSPGGSRSPSLSPTGNPADINAPPPRGSSEKLAVSAIFPLAIIIFGFGFFH